MKKKLFNLFLFGALALLPGWSHAQVVFQNLTVQPVILCSGNPMTVTFQAALPGNSTGGQNLYLYGTIDSSATVSATSNVILWSGSTFNAGTDTFTGAPTVLSPAWAATWYMAAPAFANFVTYTVISTVPAYANGTPVYITIGGDNAYTSGYTLPYSIQIPATVDCTKSDAINTGKGVFVNAGVTYTGESNPVTLQINNSCSSPTFTNTATNTFTKTYTATFTNTFTPTPSATFTNTFTKTFTATFTNTFTNTFTPTVTNTPTATKTNTSTFTNTYTSTFTDSPTPSPTFTNTFTKTYTATFTNTFTPTVTATFTNTFQNTPTFTNTFTKTPTTTFTNTPTASPTPTYTFTHTPTFTYTNTFMNSPTFTNTFTNTPTMTYTNTFQNTPTYTNTFTNTPTLTYTNTFQNTPTNTNTFTDTPTQTYTNTFQNTPTDTNTFTNTPTQTYTNTLLNTATPTNTFTATNSYTFTNTPTYTDTRTPTQTNTNTLINTATSTNTPTSTNTLTVTNTFTVTPTFTTNTGFGKTVNKTLANSGDVLNYTLAVTVTGNNLTNTVITDAIPTNMTFVAFVSSPAGTQTSSTNANTQLQWILPASLGPGVYDLTYQLKVNTFAPANVPLTNHAVLEATGVSLTASVPVTIIGNFNIAINIYNSSGEIVKTIPIQSFSTAINNIALSTTNTITTLSGPGSTIDILFNGYVIGVWNGTNNAQQPVNNGSYQIQVDNIGSTGTVTTVSQTAIVSRSLSTVEVDIFNEAGEIVRKLYNVMSNPTTSNMTNVTLNTTVLRPNVNNIQANQNSSLLQILVQDTNQPVTLMWNGTADSGAYVTPGIYEIQVHWTNGNGTTTDITRSILVMPSGAVSGIAVARPNTLTTATTMTTTFDVSGVANAAAFKVKIYTIMGELVQTFTSSNLTTTWNASGLASGIYIADVEIDNSTGGVVNNQRLKLLVMH